MILNCPSCGAELPFRSRSSVSAVCAFCRSLVVRHDVNVALIGKATEFPQDLTPFKVGTTGAYRGRAFEIVGRKRLAWADGAWNEWFLQYQDGSSGWLTDAQGLYFISHQIEELAIPHWRDLRVGARANLMKKTFAVDDTKEAKCVAIEGELPMQVALDEVGHSVDLSNEDNEHMGLTFTRENSIASPEQAAAKQENWVEVRRAFSGSYVEPEELNLKNLREIDGW